MKTKLMLMLVLSALLNLALATESQPAQTPADEADSEQTYIAWATEILESLEPQTGQINLEKVAAKLNLPDQFYYLNPSDADTVLEDVWGNPPGPQTLGMLFPQGLTPFDPDVWGVTIEYQEDGYVSDQDADQINYDELLVQMQDEVKSISGQRVQQGYETIELVGWAAPPFYDAQSNKLHWAKELKFGGEEVNTLNYDIRVLGRKGVLILSFIARIDQQAMIESNLDQVLAMAQFDQGAQYSDFNPDIDKVAGYGLGALVAGKVLAKTGLLAAALIFFKKFWVFIVLALGALAKGFFSQKKRQQHQE